MADPEQLLAEKRKDLGFFQGMQYLFRHHDPKLLVLLGLVYFTQGLSNLTITAAFFYYKENLNNGDEVMAQVVIPLLRVAWLIKPLFAFFIDAWPICGSNRHPYLILSAAVGIATNYALSQSLSQTYFILAFVAMQVSQVISDIVADAITASESRKDEAVGDAFLPSYNFALSAIAIIIEGFGFGLLWSFIEFSPMYSFQVMIGTNALIVVAGLLYHNEQDSPVTELAANWSVLIRTFKKPPVFRTLLLIGIVIASTSRFSLTMGIFNCSVPPLTKYYLRDEFKFSVSFFHNLNGFFGVAFLLGGTMYSHFLKRFSMRNTMSVGFCAVLVCSAFTFFLVYARGEPWFYAEVYVYCVAVFSTTLHVALLMMPSQILSIRMCPHNLEGTMMACIMSWMNIAIYVSDLVGAAFIVIAGSQGYTNLAMFLVLQLLVASLPLFFIKLLPKNLKASSFA